MKSGWLVLLLLSASAEASSPVVSGPQDRTALALTVYSSGRGLVREERSLDLPSGVAEVHFTGVPEKVEAPTVHVAILEGAPVSVLEQNYEYDLLSPEKLLEKFVGQTVTLVQEKMKDNSTVEEEVPAKLLSTNSGTVWEIQGRIVTNPPYSRLSFPSVPGNLIAHPTLVWLLDGKGAGKRKVEAAYLTSGISWHADYILALDASEEKASLEGWVTIENQSGAAYPNALLKLVAGDVHEVPVARSLPKGGLVMARVVPPPMQQEDLFEYHLYTLPRPTTLKQNQTKQVELLSSAPFPVQKDYVLRGDTSFYRSAYPTKAKQKVSVVLKFKNGEAQGLGSPLPAGTIRVYKNDRAGSPQFIGEDQVGHTPKDEELKLQMGSAFDVVAEKTQTDFKKLANNVTESAYEVRLRNHKEVPVTVRVLEPIGGDWTIVEHSLPFQKTQAFEAEFDVTVPPGKESVLTYRVRSF
jgi:hypothetical protein